MTLETISETHLDELEARLGVRFNDRNLLKQALTHESFVNEWGAENAAASMASYERLEFLGDSVLNFAVANELFDRSDDATEGELSMGRANIVCKDSLAKAADALNLGDYILRGRGEMVYSPNVRDSVLEDAFEAIIGAIHIDQGLNAALAFVFQHLGRQIEDVAKNGVEKDPKSAFQELVQGAGLKTPRYHTELSKVNEYGEQHYLASVMIGRRVVANGIGESKSKAQQRAAAKAKEVFSDGIPSEFAAMAAKRHVPRKTNDIASESFGLEGTRLVKSKNWRRFGSWISVALFRRGQPSPRRRLIYKRPN